MRLLKWPLVAATCLGFIGCGGAGSGDLPKASVADPKAEKVVPIAPEAGKKSGTTGPTTDLKPQ